MNVRLDPSVKTQDLSGWFLAESSLGHSARNGFASLLVRRHPGSAEVDEIRLPVTPDGRIRELVMLPRGVTDLAWQPPGHPRFDQTQLMIRRVGWLERTWRMANRVLRNWMRLSADERITSGLSLWRALYDLPGAYRIASRFRGNLPYADWIESFDVLREEDCNRIRAHIACFPSRPHFYLLLVADRTGQGAVQATLTSLRAQLYQTFTCKVLDSAGALGSLHSGAGLADAGVDSSVVAGGAVAEWLSGFNAMLAEQHAGEWVMVLRAGDVLPPHALYWFASEVLARPNAAIVYADDDILNVQGRRSRPRFKPDWSLAHLRSTHYAGDRALLRGSAMAAAGGLNLDCCRQGTYDLLLRIIDSAGEQVHHIPAVLLHRRYDGAAKDPDIAVWQANAVRAHLARRGVAADVTQTRQECRRVRYRLPSPPPLVSIVVPTRDAPALIRQCMLSVLEKTTYPRFEILVVDNQTVDRQSLDYLEQIAKHPAVRLLRYDRPFSFAAINNFAVRQASGSVICLLNNDTEVISPDWLEEMVGHLVQPRVGVTGAKLYYPDGRVQHAGDVVGPGGCANHLHSSIGRDDPGYCKRAVVAQDLSAVTAACLITWRELYLRLGGLDEKHLAVAFNDVDYCLRVRSAGYRVVWTPHAELYHHESVSRGADRSRRQRLRAKGEVATMRRRWGHVMECDPFYNPNLSYQRPDFSWSGAPRVKKPWLK